MTFSKTGGLFLTTGIQNVILDGSGTPTGTPGAVNFSVTAGTSTCGFQLTTVAGAAFSLDCAGATVNGSYEAGVALIPASNTISISANVTTAGPYTITATINNMTFTASGTFPTAPATVALTLAGSGTPQADGTFNLPVPGTTPCTVPVIVDPSTTGGTGILTCKINGVFRTFNFFAEATYFTPNSDITISGDAVMAGDERFLLGINRVNGNAITPGTYTVNGLMSFYLVTGDYTDPTPAHWIASTDIFGGTQNPAFTIIVSTVTANRITGTFFGPIKDNAGAGPGVKTITEGVFDVPIN
jgi:hypothetical protein